MIKRYLVLLIIISTQFVVYSQKNIAVLKVHLAVGDTIDFEEKIKYKLFQDFSEQTYLYAQYLSFDNKIILRITQLDGSYIDEKYKIEWLIEDGKLIELNQFEASLVSSSEESKKTLTKYKKRIKVLEHESGRSMYLKKGNTCHIALKKAKEGKENIIYNYQIEEKFRNRPSFKYVRILEIIETPIASIKVKCISEMGRIMILPLSDINKIKKHVDAPSRYTLGVGSFGTSGVIIAAVASGAPTLLTFLAAPFVYFGVKLFSNNHTFDLMARSEIGIVYI